MSGRLPEGWPLPTAPTGTLLANPEAEELLDALSDLAADTEEAAIKDAPRKVRSDKGIKRGQRTREGGDPVPGAVRLAAAESLRAKRGQRTKGGEKPVPDAEARHDVRPPTLVQDWLNTALPGSNILESTDNVKPPIDEYEGRRTPRKGYIAVETHWLPLIGTFEEAHKLATATCETGEPHYIFYVEPVSKLERSIKETRLGRVRRRKAKP